MMRTRAPLLSTVYRLLLSIGLARAAVSGVLDPNSTLDCHKRLYSYKVTQTDSQGKICWDTISVMSCWGRCDSNEISDWRFPYKRSYHPVCLHGLREPRTVLLKHCEEGVEPGTQLHEYLHAVSCKCHVCKSSSASCQGLRGTMLKEGRDLMMSSLDGVSAWRETIEDTA